MSGICWWLVRIISRSLEPDEEVVVRGDLQECGDSSLGALFAVAGLVLRRQFQLWRSWQPWLAVVGIAGVSGFFLSGSLIQFDSVFFWRLRGYLYDEVMYNFRTDNEELLYLATLGAAIFVWSWLSAYVLRILSGRATWLNATLFYVAVLSGFRIWQITHGKLAVFGMPSKETLLFGLFMLLPIRPGTLFLFAIPAYWAQRAARQFEDFRADRALMLGALVVTTTTLLTWTSGFYGTNRQAMSHGMYHAQSWPTRLWPFLILSWPMIYVILLGFYRQPHTTRREP